MARQEFDALSGSRTTVPLTSTLSEQDSWQGEGGNARPLFAAT